MQRPFKFTKLKLITGYILILLLGAIAIVFIYKQTIALTQKGNDEIVMQQKLFIISNTLTKLYEAENTGIAFSQTGTQKNFDTYMKLIEDIKDNMDTLKNLSISSEQNLRIDTINTLLGKRRNFISNGIGLLNRTYLGNRHTLKVIIELFKNVSISLKASIYASCF